MSRKIVGRSALASRLLVGMAMVAGMVTPASTASAASPAPDVQGILAAHNRERAAVGVAPVSWSNILRNNAQTWANHLAAIHQLQHSVPGVNRSTSEGENLASGTKGAFSDRQMIGLWIAEKKNFIPGKPFGNAASKTRRWQDIGHYTQVIWWNTTHVGCGKASDTIRDYFVCRYGPAGNVLGQYPLGHK